jgi:hypothetical protein
MNIANKPGLLLEAMKEHEETIARRGGIEPIKL